MVLYNPPKSISSKNGKQSGNVTLPYKEQSTALSQCLNIAKKVAKKINKSGIHFASAGGVLRSPCNALVACVANYFWGGICRARRAGFIRQRWL